MFFAVSAMHLIASFRDDAAGRKKTKPFLLLLLLFWYLASTENPEPYLILALLTSWLGDVLLIPKGHQWFTAGGISFMFSHFFFVLVYLRRITLSNILPAVLAAAVYLWISLKIMYMVKDNTPKKMVIPMGFYLICNSTMNIFALLQLLCTHSLGAFTAWVGAVLFFVSDCSLFIVRYYTNPEIIYKKHFTVMLTYLLGEFLIVAGMLQLNG